MLFQDKAHISDKGYSLDVICGIKRILSEANFKELYWTFACCVHTWPIYFYILATFIY